MIKSINFCYPIIIIEQFFILCLLCRSSKRCNRATWNRGQAIITQNTRKYFKNYKSIVRVHCCHGNCKFMVGGTKLILMYNSLENHFQFFSNYIAVWLCTVLDLSNTFCYYFRWEQPAQYLVPWETVEGMNMRNWKDQWTVMTTRLRQLQTKKWTLLSIGNKGCVK